MSCILLVEDNFDMLYMLSQLLELTGHEVITGRSGEEGLHVLNQREPALIISDLLMPRMSGFDFLTHVRSNPAWSHIPFVVMSAHNNESERSQLLQHGANGYLTKPFDLEELNAVLLNCNISPDY